VEFNSWQGQILLSLYRKRVALRSTKPPIQHVLEVKWPGCEADHSHPSSAKIKEAQNYYAPPCVFIAWCSIDYWGDFTPFQNKTLIFGTIFQFKKTVRKSIISSKK
jgi:hypothetical protein